MNPTSIENVRGMRQSAAKIALGILLGAFATAAPGADPLPAFPLKMSANHRYLVDQNERPFFVMGDTPWFVQKVKLEDARLILDDRKTKGFNSLFLEILDDSALPSKDAYGNVAFDPPLDITKPAEAFWQYADTVMEEATKRGFFVIMSDLWYGAGKGLWMHHVAPEAARVYGHFLGKRYARFNNLMWMHCGDRNPDERLAQCARELANAIRAEAPAHLHTAHLEHEFASAAFFHKEPWLDVNMAYTYGASYLHVLPEYNRKDPVRPVILGETGYEDEPNAIELLPDAKKGDLWNPYRIRRNAWWAVLSGATGYCAGTRLWRFESNWKSVLQAVSTRQAPILKQVLEGRPWWRLAPDQKHEFVTAGYGTWKQADYVTAALAEDRSLGVAYLPSPRKIEINPAVFPRSVNAEWYDPATGRSFRAQGSPHAKSGKLALEPPDRSDNESDWVLVLEKAP
jgi:hypothetical protein